MVAVRYQSHWYRARVLEFKPTTNFAWVCQMQDERIFVLLEHLFIFRFILLIKVKSEN